MIIVVYIHTFAGQIRMDNSSQSQTNHGKYKNKTVIIRTEIYAEKWNYGRYV